MLKPITIRGRYFWRGDQRFMVRGLVYQDYGSDHPRDPIADDRLPQLRHDIALFRELGINTILIYQIDASKGHHEAMELLADAGIYVLTKVCTPFNSINRLRPRESYKPENVQSYFRAVDVMAQFPNILGVYATYFTVNNQQTENAAPMIPAVVHDLKKYMKIKYKATGQRILPLGYGATKPDDGNKALLTYLSSGPADQRIDFWTCTALALQNDSGTEEIGYAELAESLQDANLPIFFSEYGYTRNRPRAFDETTVLYSSQMTNVLSGGCVYEMSQDSNRYGLVEMMTSRDKYGGARDPVFPPHQTRETELGTLLVFDDFENYKAKLLATKDVELTTDPTVIFQGDTRDVPADIRARFEAQGQTPDSCVDWAQYDA